MKTATLLALEDVQGPATYLVLAGVMRVGMDHFKVNVIQRVIHGKNTWILLLDCVDAALTCAVRDAQDQPGELVKVDVMLATTSGKESVLLHVL